MKPRALLLPLAVAASATAAEAQINVKYAPATAPPLGYVIAGNASTTFSVTTAGVVTRTSGNAIRVSNSSVTTPTISIECGMLNLSQLCVLRYMRVTITPAGGTGPASVAKLRVGSLTGATFRDGAPAESSTVTFVLNPMGISTASFKLGMDVMLSAGSAPGPTTFSYAVSAEFL